MGAKTRFSTHDRKFLAIVKLSKSFKPYMANGHAIVQSDREPLNFIKS